MPPAPPLWLQVLLNALFIAALIFAVRKLRQRSRRRGLVA